MNYGRFQSQQNHCLQMHIPTIKAQLADNQFLGPTIRTRIFWDPGLFFLLQYPDS